MPNTADASPEANLTNREITNLVRDLINSRPGLNRLVTQVSVDASLSTGNTCVIKVHVNRVTIGGGGGGGAAPGTAPSSTKSKIVGDETFALSDGEGGADQAGIPDGLVEEA